MISGRIIRIYVSDGQEPVPAGYTHRSGLLGLLGLKGDNIHIHLGEGWDSADGEDALKRLQQMSINLSCNRVLPTITIGPFDKRISSMLIAMEVLAV